MVTEPLSDYVRFECAWCYRHMILAGEGVRVIAFPEKEWPGSLLRYDYWLLDSSALLVMNYANGGTFLSAELVDDPAWVVQANKWRDQAVHLSIPFVDYAAGFDEFMRRLPDGL